jgi:hypothetical protein
MVFSSVSQHAFAGKAQTSQPFDVLDILRYTAGSPGLDGFWTIAAAAVDDLLSDSTKAAGEVGEVKVTDRFVTPLELYTNTELYVIVDMRSTYCAGHIGGAFASFNIPITKVAHPDNLDLLDMGMPIVVICGSGQSPAS